MKNGEDEEEEKKKKVKIKKKEDKKVNDEDWEVHASMHSAHYLTPGICLRFMLYRQ